MEGSEAIAEAMVAAGCRFFAGYPMTPFTEVLEHMARLLPEVGGVCINAESELEAVGMAWGAAATGTRAATGSVGQGLSLMQESLSEICQARAAARGAQHGARSGRLLPGHPGRRARRLPAHRAGPGRRPRGGRAGPAGLPPGRPVAQPGDLPGRLLPGPRARGGRGRRRLDFGPLPEKDWAWTARAAAADRPSSSRRSGSNEAGRPGYVDHGTHLATIASTSGRSAGVEPLVETACAGGRRAGGRRLRDARQLRPLRRRAAARRRAAGRVRRGRSRCGRFPTAAIAEAAARRRAVAVYELNTGQMVDDVRLAVLGRCPVSSSAG